MQWLDATDLISGFFLGAWYTVHYWKPVLPIKVTKLEPEKLPKDQPWLDALMPVIRRFEVANAIGGTATFNAKGGLAIAKLMREIARRMDIAAQRELMGTPREETTITKRIDKAVEDNK